MIIRLWLIVQVRCFINSFPIKLKNTRLNQNKTPLIIYNSESNVVISNIIEKTDNQLYDDGNNTSVLINPTNRPPIYPSFQNLCKMNFVALL